MWSPVRLRLRADLPLNSGKRLKRPNATSPVSKMEAKAPGLRSAEPPPGWWETRSPALATVTVWSSQPTSARSPHFYSRRKNVKEPKTLVNTVNWPWTKERRQHDGTKVFRQRRWSHGTSTGHSASEDTDLTPATHVRSRWTPVLHVKCKTMNLWKT